jgi:hypothetical protein
MKLLYCKNCRDIFNLSYDVKTCSCGDTAGRYVDNLNAIYTGKNAIPLGIGNSSFHEAINNQPLCGWGKEFDAFVIEVDCPTFKKKPRRNIPKAK